MSPFRIGVLGCGMIAELGHLPAFAQALSTGQARHMPTARDGLLATRIARQATEEAIRDRERSSLAHPSTLVRAEPTGVVPAHSPLDAEDVDETLFETNRALETTES